MSAQQPLAGIFETAHDAFISMSDAGEITYWNARAEQMFGFTSEAAVGMSLADAIVPPRLRGAHRRGLQRFLHSGVGTILDRPVDVQACRQDESEFPVRLTVCAVALAQGGWVFHALVQDQSERARLLAQLEAMVRSQGPGFGDLLDDLAEAVTIRDRANTIIYANRAALRHMGFSSLAQMQARSPGSIMGDYIVTDEDGRDVTLDDIPSVRLLRGQPAVPLVIRTVHRDSGQAHWNVLKASGLRNETGEIVATVMIIEDITSVKTAELRSRFLADASRQLAASLDYTQTLSTVAWAAVPQIADWCAVDLLDEHGRLQRVVAAHRDPNKRILADRLRDFAPERLDPTQGAGRVVHSGTSQLYPQISEEMLAAAAKNDQHLRLMNALGMRSAVIVALKTTRATLGTMTLVSSESGRRFDHDDVLFAEQIADRAAVAVENARLYDAQVRTAVTLQRSLLPEVVPEIPGWEAAARYRPAGSDPRVEVGGDFYDFTPTPAGWMVIIGDVTGKGVQAAALTSLLRHGARVISQTETRPSVILQRLNVALAQQQVLSPCTALCLLLGKDGQLALASAGHPLPLLIGRDGEVRELGAPQRLIGLPHPYAWHDQIITIDPGETIVLHTDGITDATGATQRFGEQRLHALLRDHADRAPDALLSELEATLDAFQVGPQADDTALIALRHAITPAAHSPPLHPAHTRAEHPVAPRVHVATRTHGVPSRPAVTPTVRTPRRYRARARL
jgi:PAS domain S-box-containing protein